MSILSWFGQGCKWQGWKLVQGIIKTGLENSLGDYLHMGGNYSAGMDVVS